jgi:hypothetical protein
MKSVSCILLLFVTVICLSCQSGLIPCPHPKAMKLRESNVKLARVDKNNNRQPLYSGSDKTWKQNDSKDSSKGNIKELRRESRVDKKPAEANDWDCPKPGASKKVAKENKKNMDRKIRDSMRKTKSLDSLSIVPSQRIR